MAQTKKVVTVTPTQNQTEILVVEADQLPEFTRGSKNDLYVEKFKTLKTGQSIVIKNHERSMRTALYGLFKRRKVSNISYKVKDNDLYLIKTN